MRRHREQTESNNMYRRSRRVLVSIAFINGMLSIPTPEATTTHGESCRMEKIDNWLKISSLESQSLADVRGSELYKNIVEDCAFFVAAYNTVAGQICTKEATETCETVSYSQSWKIGPINMDAEWLLAKDLELSDNLKHSTALVPYSDSCYSEVGDFNLDTSQIAPIVDASAFPTEEFLCSGWLEGDNAYLSLRMCAAESIVARTMIAERDRNNSENPSGSIEQASTIAADYAMHLQKQTECMTSKLEGTNCIEDSCKEYSRSPTWSPTWSPSWSQILADYDELARKDPNASGAIVPPPPPPLDPIVPPPPSPLDPIVPPPPPPLDPIVPPIEPMNAVQADTELAAMVSILVPSIVVCAGIVTTIVICKRKYRQQGKTELEAVDAADNDLP